MKWLERLLGIQSPEDFIRAENKRKADEYRAWVKRRCETEGCVYDDGDVECLRCGKRRSLSAISQDDLEWAMWLNRHRRDYFDRITEAARLERKE